MHSDGKKHRFALLFAAGDLQRYVAMKYEHQSKGIQSY
jgi:hypothetical protein